VAYEIRYTPAARAHLKELTARQRATVVRGVEEQLVHQPTVETRHRKPMRASPIAPWELRIGDLRVYYDVEHEPEQMVGIVAIGIKRRNHVTISGVEVDL